MIRPDLDITLLRCFLTVLDAGGFARAASLLGRTQPAVSQQIRRLEDLLGHRLIQRASPGRSQPPQPTAWGMPSVRSKPAAADGRGGTVGRTGPAADCAA